MDVLPSLIAEEVLDDTQIPELFKLSVANQSSLFSSSIIDRNATAAAGKVLYHHADSDVTSKIIRLLWKRLLSAPVQLLQKKLQLL